MAEDCITSGSEQSNFGFYWDHSTSPETLQFPERRPSKGFAPGEVVAARGHYRTKVFEVGNSVNEFPLNVKWLTRELH